MTKPLFDVFRDAMERKPTGSRKEALDQFVAAMKSDPKYLEDLATDYFHRMSAAWTVRDEKHGYSFGRVVEPSVKIEEVRTKRAFSAERTATALETLKAKIRDVILLDLVLPNGVSLRHATGADGGVHGRVVGAVFCPAPGNLGVNNRPKTKVTRPLQGRTIRAKFCVKLWLCSDSTALKRSGVPPASLRCPAPCSGSRTRDAHCDTVSNRTYRGAVPLSPCFATPRPPSCRRTNPSDTTSGAPPA